jgi:hypothetical protein
MRKFTLFVFLLSVSASPAKAASLTTVFAANGSSEGNNMCSTSTC